jgi:hypothetical protein
MTLEGTVTNGAIVLDGGPSLPEGARVKVELVADSQPQRAASPLAQGLLEFAGKATGLPSDMARNHNHYIHGATKK